MPPLNHQTRPLYSSALNDSSSPSHLPLSYSILRPNLRDPLSSRFPIKPSSKSYSVFPVIWAQASSNYIPDVKFCKVEAILRPWRVPQASSVEAVVDKIIAQARTGEIGDGMILLVPVTDVIRVRTGERGEKAERMMGGWSDMSSPPSPA